MLDGLAEELLKWAMQYPAISTSLMVLGVVRVVMKPLMAFMNEFVNITSGIGDNEFLKSLEDNKIFKGFLFVIDWLGSVKIRK